MMTDYQTSVGDDPAVRTGRVEVDARSPASDAALDDVAAYEDDGALVICDRSNPNGWIRSASPATLEP